MGEYVESDVADTTWEIIGGFDSKNCEKGKCVTDYTFDSLALPTNFTFQFLAPPGKEIFIRRGAERDGQPAILLTFMGSAVGDVDDTLCMPIQFFDESDITVDIVG